jgi:hypothetical protein
MIRIEITAAAYEALAALAIRGLKRDLFRLKHILRF